MEHICTNCNKRFIAHRSKRKYCSNACQMEYQQKEWEKKWFSGEISGTSENDHWGNVLNRIRTYLFKKYNNKCSNCGWSERNPYTNLIPLEVEHIDGNSKNNRPENVTLLCPNCHSLTPTYRGANRGRGREKTWLPNKIAEQQFY